MNFFQDKFIIIYLYGVPQEEGEREKKKTVSPEIKAHSVLRKAQIKNITTMTKQNNNRISRTFDILIIPF